MLFFERVSNSIPDETFGCWDGEEDVVCAGWGAGVGWVGWDLGGVWVWVWLTGFNWGLEGTGTGKALKNINNGNDAISIIEISKLKIRFRS